MPKVTINEIDQSRYVQSGASAPMVVLVPGTASFGPVFDELNPSVVSFSGAAGLQSFYQTFGYNPATITKTVEGTTDKTYLGTIDGDLSFEYVTNLLNNGATVQFLRLNEGIAAASKPIDTVDYADVGSTEIKFTARHTGRFGNYLVVQLKKEKDTEGVISVYMKTPRFAEANKGESISEDKLVRMTQLEGFRVSTDPTSPYFSNLNAFNYIANIPARELAAMFNKLTADKKTSIVCPLFGAYDFAKNITASDTYAATTEATENDDILKVLTEKLGVTISEDGTVTDESVYTSFTDPYLFDFDFVTSAGFFTDSEDTLKIYSDNTATTVDPIHTAMINLCEARGDCIALLDTPKTLAAIHSAKVASGTAAQPDCTVSSYAKRINTSYAAIYAPWCSVVSNSTAAIIEMPASYIFMSAILKGMSTSVNNDLWYVPAGVNRAAAPFIVAPRYEIGSTILDKFQNTENFRVNPIMKVRNYGYCVYGNSTCLQSIPGVSRSALESMNVRLLCNVIKKTIFAVCSSLAFEYNDSRLWAKFYSQMDKVLLYMKRNYGLYDYKIIMDGTTVTSQAMNERRVPGKILVSPTLAGEYFDIDFEISPSGVSFNEEA